MPGYVADGSLSVRPQTKASGNKFWLAAKKIVKIYRRWVGVAQQSRVAAKTTVAVHWHFDQTIVGLPNKIDVVVKCQLRK